jgi:predicted amidohydrolase
MRNKAEKFNCVVTGSILTKENDRFFNRLVWMKPDGTYNTYDKRHLFRLTNEQLHFDAGSTKLITEINGWKICPLICYDLRFPVWSKNKYINDAYEYDVLIYIANWPEIRSYAWKSLLIARAIENQAYVIGVNRVGKDGNNIVHSGDSMIIDFAGKALSDIQAHTESTLTLSLSVAELNSSRKHFPIGLDWDKFKIIDD